VTAVVLLRAVLDSEPSAPGRRLLLDAPSLAALALALGWRRRDAGTLIGLAAGPEAWEPALRDGLALGLDTVTRVDMDSGGADVVSTATALAGAIPPGTRLVVAGAAASDHGSGALPGAVAGILDRPLLSEVTALSAAGDGLRVETKAGAGRFRVYEVEAPVVLVAAARGGAQSLYPRLASRLAAARATIETVRPAGSGHGGSRLRVLGTGPGRPRTRRLLKPQAGASSGERLGQLMAAGARRGSGSRIEGEVAALARQLVEVLEGNGFLPAASVRQR
jgi:electron transfer flavoprotein alpha/beta subunit